MKKIIWLAALLVAGLLARSGAAEGRAKGLLLARQGFVTQAAPSTYHRDGPAPAPAKAFDRIRYRSPAGDLVAYVSHDPGDGKRRPAVLWAHGGFGGIDETTIEQVAPLVAAGLVVMCPSWRGENDNRGRYEMFYGEVDDALAALDHLARLPYVDPAHLYVAGHSTGGTIALLVAESTDRIRAALSLGGAPDLERLVAEGGYPEATPPFPLARPHEAELRSPIRFVSEIRARTFYFEGATGSAYVADADRMELAATVAGVPFSAHAIPNGDHFTIVAPLLQLFASKIAAGSVSITPADAEAAFVASRPVTVLRHEPTQLEMALRAGGAAVCQALPEGHEDPAACEGLDPAAMRRAFASNSQPIVAGAIVRYDGWSVPVLVTIQPGGMPLSTPADRDEFAKGMRKGVLDKGPGARIHGDSPSETYTTVTVDGRPALRLTLDMTSGPQGPSRSMLYVVPTDDAGVLLTFVGDEQHFAEVRRLAEASVATLRVKAPAPAPQGSTRAYLLGRAIGKAMVWLVIGGVVVAVLVAGSRRKRT